MSLFDTISEDLFKPLTSINKRNYADILSLLWDECRRKPMYMIAKSDAIDMVEQYCIGYCKDIQMDDDDDDESSQDNDSRANATHFLRRLKATGWLIEREGDYEEETKLAISHTVVPIIKSFVDIINPKIITYKGKLFEIYSLLLSLKENDNPYENCLKTADENFQELNSSLHQLDASIEEHIDLLTKGKTPEEVLELFDNYEERVVVGSYHRFKTNDNLFYYKTSLYDFLDECEEQYYDVLVKDYIDTEKTDEVNARCEITRIIDSIRMALKEMDEMIRVIDDRHLLYRTRAVQRAQFLLLADGSTKSKINLILKNYAAGINTKEDIQAYDDTLGADVFRIYGQNYFDEQSLATPYKKRMATPIDSMIEVTEIDKEYLEEQMKLLAEETKKAVSLDNVNKFATEMLGGRRSISASEIMSNESDAAFKLIGIYTYSESCDRKYNIRMKNKQITVNGLRFLDFEIERK